MEEREIVIKPPKVRFDYAIWGIGILVAIIFFYNGNQERYFKQPWEKTINCELAHKYLAENDKGKQFEVTIKYKEVPGFSAVQVQQEIDYTTVNLWYETPNWCNGNPIGEKVIYTNEGEARSKTLREIINDEVIVLGATLGIFILYKAFSKH